MAGSLITMGTLGDRIGRRKLLLIGAAAFGVDLDRSRRFRPAPTMLIASRALLGFAGATLAPSTLSLIRNMFLDDKQRTVAIGIWITSYCAGAAIGPLARWPAAGVLLVGLGLPAGRAGHGAAARPRPLLLPEFRDPNAGQPDVLSAALSLAGVLLVIFGLKRIAQDGFGPCPPRRSWPASPSAQPSCDASCT